MGIWDRTKELIGKDFHFEIIHNNKYVAFKIKSYNNKIKTNFHDRGLLPEQTPCLTYLVILIDTVYKSDKS